MKRLIFITLALASLGTKAQFWIPNDFAVDFSESIRVQDSTYLNGSKIKLETMPARDNTQGRIIVVDSSDNMINYRDVSTITSATDLSFSGASSPVTLNSSTGTDVTITAGGINTFSQAGNNLTITGTEVDGSVSNEIQNLSYDAANHEVDISLGGTSATIPLALDDGATEGLASFTAADFDVTAGNVALDYTTLGGVYLKLDQTTPQTVNSGKPIFSSGLNLSTGASIQYNSSPYISSFGGQIGFVGENTAVGYKSGSLLNTGAYANTLIGFKSGQSLAWVASADARSNTAVGYQTLQSATTAGYNTVVGTVSGGSLTTQTNNTFIGYHCGISATSNFAVCIGSSAGESNTADRLVAVGVNAGNVNTGTNNTFVGNFSGQNNTSGGKNTFIGWNTGVSSTTNEENTFLGYLAGNAATGSYNVAVGSEAGSGASFSGSRNTLIGRFAGDILSSGGDNIFIGKNAGSTMTTGSGNIIIGVDLLTVDGGATASHELRIRDGIYGKSLNSSTAVKIGFGVTTPTAALHLRAGTATASTAPLKFTTGTNLTVAEAGAMEYTTPQLFFTNGRAVRQEIPQIQQSRVSTQYDNTTVTLGNVTGLTANVAASGTYRFTATLFTTSDVAGGVKVAIGGTATATSIRYEVLITDSGLTTQGRQTALAGATGVTAVTAALVKIEGLIVVNAAGTLTVQAAQNANTGTTSVLTGSTFVITEML